MTQDAQQIAIAKACGFHPVVNPTGGGFTVDRNAMADAEGCLSILPCFFEAYCERLAAMNSNHEVEPDRRWYYAVVATPSQRAEAFLRTLGLWKDE